MANNSATEIGRVLWPSCVPVIVCRLSIGQPQPDQLAG
ncbi:hypothetical protein I552_7032 [Mycobacterium xenopi 3993]|nr:hypothetical protein I552_7032 [Mycobacterium xenopi 3993]